MVAFRRHEAWDHTASIIAAIYQSTCAEAGRVFWPEAHHPGYVPIDGMVDAGGGDRVLPKGSVPNEMVFGMMRKAIVDGS